LRSARHCADPRARAPDLEQEGRPDTHRLRLRAAAAMTAVTFLLWQARQDSCTRIPPRGDWTLGESLFTFSPAAGAAPGDLMRLDIVFVSVCMVLIAGSAGAVTYSALGFGAGSATLTAMAVLALLILYNLLSARFAVRPAPASLPGDLTRLNIDAARQEAARQEALRQDAMRQDMARQIAQ